ncbi:aspartate/glutamate racemase family protein [Hoeflea prorocentri]|uniref:Aspartate/glutamate racemase family protein n=1 Tax=Hoeflea prorocentri TaxID=1922333 RepID=A0A9X3UDL8_9HYPH|nr:aspartate/glutamate racemase family protein [Hoeflea prorocentri]MCY6379473.1 aspartate/glutamate racemase family protein [Hoeflea prorocentri]MDA5397273.1 aspartate/glutamate racemase family protein [Hoeflea prorocentri]
MSLEYGGKTVYGANIGIMMLETQFPRIHGDIANAYTWPFPVQYRIVRGATPDKVVRKDPLALIDDFIAAAKDLVAAGCDGLTTNCGFLALIQDKVSEAVPVPVATSSLMQIPLVQHMLPRGQRVGVITISKTNLSRAHLEAANAPLDTPIVGTDNGRAFSHGILDDQPSIDFADCRLDLLDAAQELVSEYDNIGAIVLECTNMTPYAADIRKLTGLPVYSIYSFVRWFHQGLVPDRFDLRLDDPRPGLAARSPR